MPRRRRLERALFPGLVLAISLPGCSDDPTADIPDAADEGAVLVIAFEHHVDGESLLPGESLATRYGQLLAFDHIRYWTSNHFLAQGDEVVALESSYHVIEQSADAERLVIELRDVPPGSYDGYGFHIGTDPEANEDETLKADGLAYIPRVGHTYLSAAGAFEVAGESGGFEVKTFGDLLYRRLEAHLGQPLVLEAGARETITLRADVGRMFAGIDLTRTPIIHGGALDSVAGAVAANYGRMVSLAHGGQSVSMSSSLPNVGGPGESEIRSDATPPTLSEPILDFETELFCDDVPDRPDGQARGCLTPFLLADGGSYEDAGFFSFVTANGGPVRAVSSGVVDEIVFQDHSHLTHSDMFLIRVRAHDDAAYAVEYRWVKDFSVQEGDEVEAGDVLGGAGDYFSTETGIVSLGVVRTQERVQRVCPATFATGDLRGALKDALAASNEAWPEHAHVELCEVPRLVCSGDTCGGPSDFEVVYGDVDAGRRTYASSCASCHGDQGEGDVAGPLCYGPECACSDCSDHDTLADRIEDDMPPEGYCDPECAANTAAFILTELRTE